MSAWLVGLAAIGGGVGALLRSCVDLAVAARYRGPFPVAVFGINVLGSLLLGVVLGAGPAVGAGAVALLGSGVLGGFTTFSTASYQTVMLARTGSRRLAAAYGVGTLVTASTAALLGLWVGGLVFGGSGVGGLSG